MFQVRRAVFAATLLMLLLMLAALLFWLILEPPPKVTQQSPVWRDADGRERSKFRVGESAYLTRDVCSDREVKVTTARRLASADGAVQVPLTAGLGTLVKGCREVIFGLAFPPSVPPMSYVYIATVRMEVNPLRIEQVELHSPPIEVVR